MIDQDGPVDYVEGTAPVPPGSDESLSQRVRDLESRMAATITPDEYLQFMAAAHVLYTNGCQILEEQKKRHAENLTEQRKIRIRQKIMIVLLFVLFILQMVFMSVVRAQDTGLFLKGSVSRRTGEAGAGGGMDVRSLVYSPMAHGEGKIGIRINTKGFISAVRYHSPAQNAGIAVGDQVLSVNEHKPFRLSDIHGTPGQTILLEIKRYESQQFTDYLMVPFVDKNAIDYKTDPNADGLEEEAEGPV